MRGSLQFAVCSGSLQLQLQLQFAVAVAVAVTVCGRAGAVGTYDPGGTTNGINLYVGLIFFNVESF